ncbi:MAG TPA: hypothetical protein VLX92_05605 [Kofleriaceae bacterium]|nr:hypothetical protein [Kofleriaceae bacterium]
MRLPCSLLALALAACGNDGDAACQAAGLSYDNTGLPYVENWCNGCHSADVPPGMRQDAPTGVNFDSVTEIRDQLIAITDTLQDQTMPPEGGPSAADTQAMIQWLDCGAP